MGRIHRTPRLAHVVLCRLLVAPRAQSDSNALTMLSVQFSIQSQHVINLVIAFSYFMFSILSLVSCLYHIIAQYMLWFCYDFIQLYSILHAQYLSSTNAYSALHLLVM